MVKILLVLFLNIVMLILGARFVLAQDSDPIQNIAVSVIVCVISALSVWWLTLGGKWRK
jgi:uncharacterized transporter YbjL